MVTYTDFLRRKQNSALPIGFDKPQSDMQPGLFEWQKDIVRWGLKKGRAALFEDCGLGKTVQQLEWAQSVAERSNGNVLILAPLAVSGQTKREGEKFGYPVTVCRKQEDVRPGVNITNYEMLEHFDISSFAGVVLDESSILKAYTGKTKRQIVQAFANTKYRLSCSATPAPNDLMELLNQAEFLGVMKSNEALSCWFITDFNSGHYRLKGHAEKDFWRWVSTWAVCVEKPSDIGYSDEGYDLPPMQEHTIVTRYDVEDPLAEIRGGLNMSATGYHEEKRKTLKSRTEKCAEIVSQTGDQYIIWCYQNDEADALKRLLPEAVEIRGSDKAEVKEQAAMDFVNGNTRILISKPSIFGYGLNFQQCQNMVFCGLDYSFESYYQAVRRVYRFGQALPVNVWRVIGENERTILETVERKAAMKRDMGRSMAEAVKDFQTGEVRGRTFRLNLEKQTTGFPEWLRSGA